VGVSRYSATPPIIQKSTLKNILFQKEKTEKRDKNLSQQGLAHIAGPCSICLRKQVE
jgi:hypothetical protein